MNLQVTKCETYNKQSKTVWTETEVNIFDISINQESRFGKGVH